MRRRKAAILGVGLLLGVLAAAQAPPLVVELEVGAAEATVGDPVPATLTVTLPPETGLDPPRLGPQLGPFTVEEESWRPEVDPGGGDVWVWSGKLVSFRPGELEIPPVRIRVESADGEATVAESLPRTLVIRSVLEAGPDTEATPPLADIKPPARIAPDYGALQRAALILVLLLGGAALLWWLHRRYGSRLTAVEPPRDPFHRVPPHVWVYSELQKLLERRLEEQGQIAEFFDELSTILKRYLGGRYRIDLLEQTTQEVPARLEQAGAPEQPVRATVKLLARTDMVKFAKHVPDSSACREAVDEAYRIVDATKPESASSDERGAA